MVEREINFDLKVMITSTVLYLFNICTWWFKDRTFPVHWNCLNCNDQITGSNKSDKSFLQCADLRIVFVFVIVEEN